VEFRSYVRQFLGLLSLQDEVISSRAFLADEVRSGVGRVMRQLAERPPPRAYVLLIAQGRPVLDNGKRLGPRMLLGAGLHVGTDVESISLQAPHSMRHVDFTVLADLQRVRVLGVFIGVDLVSGAVGASSPVVRIPRWETGVMAHAQVALNRPLA
jgi:hypothetical protein